MLLRAPPTALSAAALTNLLLCNTEGDDGTVGGCRNCTTDGSNRCAVCWDFYALTPEGTCVLVCRLLLLLLHAAAGWVCLGCLAAAACCGQLVRCCELPTTSQLTGR